MIDSLFANPSATAAVMFAVACQILWPFCGRRSLIILLQLGINTGFTAHYGLLGYWAASAVSALAATQAVTALFAGSSGLVNRLGYCLIPAMICVGLALWTGPLTLLAVAAMSIIALGRMQTTDLPLRVMLTAGAAIWAVHDIIIASYFAFAADLMTILFCAWHMVRTNAREG